MAHGLGMPMLGSALKEWRCYFELLAREMVPFLWFLLWWWLFTAVVRYFLSTGQV